MYWSTGRHPPASSALIYIYLTVNKIIVVTEIVVLLKKYKSSISSIFPAIVILSAQVTSQYRSEPNHMARIQLRRWPNCPFGFCQIEIQSRSVPITIDGCSCGAAQTQPESAQCSSIICKGLNVQTDPRCIIRINRGLRIADATNSISTTVGSVWLGMSLSNSKTTIDTELIAAKAFLAMNASRSNFFIFYIVMPTCIPSDVDACCAMS
jgi:hypothetical protein